MEKTNCKDNHKYGLLTEKGNFFIRTCKCCQKESTFPKDHDSIQEYQDQKASKKLVENILEGNIEIFNTSDNLLRAIGTLIDNLSRTEITEIEQTKLITNINNFNEHYNKEDAQRHQLIKNSIDFIELYFKHEKVETIGGKEALPEEENDKFYDKWNNITGMFEPFFNEIYDSKKNHLATR